MLASPPPALRVLVLDAQYCHALAAVRSLGRHGTHVEVASHKPRAQGFASRYVAQRLTSPDPNRQRARYAKWLIESVQRGRYDTLLFFEEATADIVSDYRNTLAHYTGIALPDRQAFLTAAHKDRAAQLARRVGVRVPVTHELTAFEDIARLAQTLTFPLVVKGVSSSGGQQVAVANTAAELGHQVRRIAGLRRDDQLPLPVVQEYIPGDGYGMTAVMRAGKEVTSFMHRRLAEHDIRHGLELAHASTGAESVHHDDLRAAGLQVLEALHWDGVAMVEFKRHAHTGEFYFIEINPRFVGSLELAIASGVDLPWVYAQVAAGRPAVGPNRYRVGLRYRWLISKNVAEAFENPWAYALSWLDALRPGTRTDICLHDARPHLSHLRNAAWWVREHLQRRFRRAEPAVASANPEKRDAEAPSPRL